jgi:MFS family permease
VAIDQIVFSMVLPVLPVLARKYDASPIQITALVASYALAQFIFSPFLGNLSDKVGRKPILVISLFGSALGSLTIGLAGALPMLFLGRIIDGTSGTALISAQTAITDMVAPRERARYLGLMGSAFAVGFIIGPALSGVASLINPRLPFFIAAGLALINAFAAIIRLPETTPPSERTATASNEDSRPFAALRDARTIGRATWFYIVVFCLGLLAFAAVESGAFTLLTADRFGFTSAKVAGTFVLVGVILAAVQVFLVGPANDRLGIRGTLVAALSINTTGFLIIAASRNIPVLLVGIACNAVGQGLLRPTATAAVSNSVRPQNRGTAIGVQTSAQGLVRIAGPLEAGALYQGIGPSAPFIVSAIIAASTAAIAAGPGRAFDADLTQPEAPSAR